MKYKKFVVFYILMFYNMRETPFLSKVAIWWWIRDDSTIVTWRSRKERISFAEGDTGLFFNHFLNNYTKK